jgi:hypothetical protein
MGIGKQCTGGRCDSRREQLLASNALADETTIEGHRYWQECAGGKHNSRREWILASDVLADEITIEGHRYWQAMHWWKKQQ